MPSLVSYRRRARKISSMPAPPSTVPPKSSPSRYEPVTTGLPLRSTATPLPASESAPPKRCVASGTPSAEYRATKMSLRPALMRDPVPKLTAAWNVPVTTTLPIGSTATALPPASFDQRYAPAGEYFATNISLCAKLLVQPPPRSIEFSNDPVTSTLPLPSHATPLPAWTASTAPKCRDQTCPPAGESLARKTSTPELNSVPPPKSAGPENAPVTAMLPLGSTATALPEFENESPKPVDQRCPPAGENLATTIV